MKLFLTRSLLFSTILLLTSFSVFAAVPSWKIVPNESSITFTGTQNDAPVTGKFTAFTGEINFDPAALSASNARIAVDMASVTTSFADVANTLKTADWFDVKLFPKAVFTTNHFIKTGENTYQAGGTLTIRNKTIPVVLTFTTQQTSNTTASVKGSVMLKRTTFGIGQGEWAGTDEVKDDVQVNFTLNVVKK